MYKKLHIDLLGVVYEEVLIMPSYQRFDVFEAINLVYIIKVSGSKMRI